MVESEADTFEGVEASTAHCEKNDAHEPEKASELVMLPKMWESKK